MSHWAEIDTDGTVLRVLVGDSQSYDEGQSFLEKALGGLWVKTSINTIGGVHYSQEVDGNGERVPSEDQSKAFRKNYAGIGFTYDSARDAFIPPTPYGSWVLDEATCLWGPPTPMPTDGFYLWVEESVSWVEEEETL